VQKVSNLSIACEWCQLIISSDLKVDGNNEIVETYASNLSIAIRKRTPLHKQNCIGVNARITCTILRYTLRDDLFFSHNFCILSPNDSRFIGKVLMTIIHLV